MFQVIATVREMYVNVSVMKCGVAILLLKKFVAKSFSHTKCMHVEPMTNI